MTEIINSASNRHRFDESFLAKNAHESLINENRNISLFFILNFVAQFDWNMTKNENVADIGALQIAHKTWHILTNGKDRSLPGLEGLRPSQLFFISAAQVIPLLFFKYLFFDFLFFYIFIL